MPSPADSPIWRSLRRYRGPIRTNGLTGSGRRFYEWDHLHNEIEVYDSNHVHLGAMDPVTGQMINHQWREGHRVASETVPDGDGARPATGPLPGRVLTAETGEGAVSGDAIEGGACCDALVSLLEDEDVPLVYECRVREWSLFVFAIGDPEQQDWSEHLTRQRLFFCPCCGTEFPDSLRIPYFEQLRSLGIDDPWLQRDQVPVEYQSSRWWWEAGL